MGLEDRVAIITGGGQGIGEAICLELGRRGAKVAVVDINLENASKVAQTIKDAGSEAMAIKADVSRRADAERLVRETVEKFGKLDILVNNAGINRDALLEKMTEEDWDAVIAVNLKGTFLCIQAAAPEMRKNKYGRVINFSSKGGAAGNIGQVNYSASKMGIIGLTRSVAKEFGRYVQREGADMTCNAVMPGYFETPMTEKIPEKMREAFLTQVPLGRTAKPPEIAKVIAFLASPDAAYITGIALGVDGGFFMGVQS
ncbi:MAG: glucose 1-dehydrogenase [Clostridia bacterium]|nr:MAG: glucose 1-dehydrogenase [Clostridia bacterium]